jgi:hypothetical protein
LLIGLEEEARAFVADEVVSSIEIVEQLHHGGIFRSEIFVIDTVLNVRALVDRDDQVITIFSNDAVK